MAIVRKIPAKVLKVIKHTKNVCSYVFDPQKIVPHFKPGQFLHLAIDPYDPSQQWPESRVFSIANSPTRREKIKITFSVKGKFTKRMYDEIKENDIIWLKLPYGSFTFHYNDKNIVLIAGGTGITPFLSFLELMIDKKRDSNIKLYYGIRSEELILFDELISECEDNIKSFNKNLFIENYSLNITGFRKGRLNIEKIFDEVNNKENSNFYLSGPLEMVKTFKSYLINKKIDIQKIHIDEWE